MKGVRRVVVVNEIGEVCLKDFVQLADESEEVVVEKGCDGHEGGVLEIKRGDEKSVREEDRHHKHVLVTVELSFALLKSTNQVQLLVHVSEVDRLVNE